MSDAARALPESVSALPAGTRLVDFEIRGLLGVGGFGIVYLAFDHALEREVAIKEYMPASMAGRTETLHVSLRSQGDAEIFSLGLRSFVNEAKLLARFDHPSLIKVHRFWEANGTAYMAMPVLRGPTLKEIRRSAGRPMDEAWIRAILVPLLGAVEHLHKAHVYHRDIAPDNIHLEAEGRPMLLDFGAARRVISGQTQALTAILKPAYAPIEQYGESSSVKQGPWTDLYALGATLYYMLLGYPPAPATARTLSDESSGLLTQAVPGVSPQMLAIVDWMLSPRPADRPQSVAELRAVLDGRAPVPQRPAAPPPAGRWSKDASEVQAVTVPLADVEHADLEFDMPVPEAAAPVRRNDSGSARATHAHGPHTDALAMAADDLHRLHPPPGRPWLVPLALVGVLLAGVLGYAGWTRLAPASAAAPAAPASAAASPSALETSAATAATAATAAAAAATVASAPASAATVAVPSPADVATQTSAVSNAPAASAASDAVTASAGAASAPAANAPGTSAPATNAPAANTAQTNTVQSNTAALAAPGAAASARAAAAEQANAPMATPGMPMPGGRNEQGAAQAGAGSSGGARASPAAGAVRPAPVAPPGTTSGAAEPGPAATPEGLCGGRSELSYHVCMERECARPRFKNHPECQANRRRARPRESGG